MLQGVDAITRMIVRYGIFEDIYLNRSSITTAEAHLLQSMTRLYTSILVFLGRAIQYYNTATFTRMAKSVPQFTDATVDLLLSQVCLDEKDVVHNAHLVGAERQTAMANIIQSINQSQFGIFAAQCAISDPSTS
jgi:hypothetical protein